MTYLHDELLNQCTKIICEDPKHIIKFSEIFSTYIERLIKQNASDIEPIKGLIEEVNRHIHNREWIRLYDTLLFKCPDVRTT